MSIGFFTYTPRGTGPVQISGNYLSLSLSLSLPLFLFLSFSLSLSPSPTLPLSHFPRSRVAHTSQIEFLAHRGHAKRWPMGLINSLAPTECKFQKQLSLSLSLLTLFSFSFSPSLLSFQFCLSYPLSPFFSLSLSLSLPLSPSLCLFNPFHLMGPMDTFNEYSVLQNVVLMLL